MFLRSGKGRAAYPLERHFCEDACAASAARRGPSATWRWRFTTRTLEEIKERNLGWKKTTGSARKWWEAFESENRHRPALVLTLAEELKWRAATISEFFLSYVYSSTDNIQANLHYLDYTRLKKEEERNKKGK